jgi:uncharacterized phage-associated protein
MKLQKLDYYAYGWWLAYNDDPLLIEGPEVWKYGPVFGGLYRALARFGPNCIMEPQRAVPFGEAPIVDDGQEEVINFLDWIWDRYGDLTSFALSDRTHRVGTPWQQEAEKKNYRVERHHKIPDELIRAYFKKQREILEAA